MRLEAALIATCATACTISTGDAQPDLVLTREDGSRIEMPTNTETFAYCEPYDPPYHPEGAIKVFHGNRFDGASWLVWAVRGEVLRGDTVTFPVSFTTSEPARGALVFVNDDHDDNQAASDLPASAGSIAFQSADCDGFVELSVRASLASEVGGPPIMVQGSFRAPVGEPPSLLPD